MRIEHCYSIASPVSQLRVAVVHEWLTRWSGSEVVLEQILACFPQAHLFAVSFRPDTEGLKRLAGRTITTSIIQRLPGGAAHPQLWLPWLPQAIEQLDLRNFDLVISNSHCVAKGVITSPDCVHVAYVHSPARYAWDLHEVYASQVPWILRGWWRRQMHRFRAWDTASAVRPDAIACNSAYIARRIGRAWGRQAEVIHPPVTTTDIPLVTGTRENFYVTASRLVGYKQVPLIARAFSRRPDRQLRIIGDGPDLTELRQICRSAPNILLLGHLPRAKMLRELGTARAFVFAAEEDFGISPVEALACGTPVIAFRRGGATETIEEGVTGVFFPDQDEGSLLEALARFESLPAFNPESLRNAAQRFDPEVFRARFSAFVADKLRDRHLGTRRGH